MADGPTPCTLTFLDTASATQTVNTDSAHLTFSLTGIVYNDGTPNSPWIYQPWSRVLRIVSTGGPLVYP